MPFIFVWTGYLIENDKISHQVLELVLVVKEHNCPWVTIVVQLSPKEFFFHFPNQNVSPIGFLKKSGMQYFYS